MFQSVAIWSNRGFRIKPPDTLAAFSTGSATLGAEPRLGVARGGGGLLGADRALGLRAAPPALGQNLRAARLAGVPVEGVRAATYFLCAVMAALAGFLLSCFSGGAALNMGAEYLLMSIAVVVIGDSSIAGGNSNVPGIGGGHVHVPDRLDAELLRARIRGRLIMTGVIIIAIVTAASGRRRAG